MILIGFDQDPGGPQFTKQNAESIIGFGMTVSIFFPPLKTTCKWNTEIIMSCHNYKQLYQTTCKIPVKNIYNIMHNLYRKLCINFVNMLAKMIGIGRTSFVAKGNRMCVSGGVQAFTIRIFLRMYKPKKIRTNFAKTC